MKQSLLHRLLSVGLALVLLGGCGAKPTQEELARQLLEQVYTVPAGQEEPDEASLQEQYADSFTAQGYEKALANRTLTTLLKLAASYGIAIQPQQVVLTPPQGGIGHWQFSVTAQCTPQEGEAVTVTFPGALTFSETEEDKVELLVLDGPGDLHEQMQQAGVEPQQ